jgi:hypothetical protein
MKRSDGLKLHSLCNEYATRGRIDLLGVMVANQMAG